MCEYKVNKEHFCERPILFLIKIVDENILYFLHFIKTLPNFQNHAKPNVFGDDKFCIDIYN